MKGMEEWGSRRRIDFLTPDTFLRKIIVVSTTCNNNGSETARLDVHALNYFHAEKELQRGERWKKLKEHKTWKQAMKFHDTYINKLKFKDSKKI